MHHRYIAMVYNYNYVTYTIWPEMLTGIMGFIIT